MKQGTCFALVALAIFSASFASNSQTPHIRQRWHWSTSFPSPFELLGRTPKHPQKWIDKRYLFQRTGKMNDLLGEAGRPDAIARQYFISETTAGPAPKGFPLYATLKYSYRDGTHVYVTTTQMRRINEVFVYRKGKATLLFK